MSNIVNKVKAAVPGTEEHKEKKAVQQGTTGTGSHGNTGSSALGGAHDTTGAGSSYGSTTGTTTGYGSTTGTTGHGTDATGPAPHTAGPHRTDAFNKGDPRVDSDLDNRGIGSTNYSTGDATGHAPGNAGPHRTDAYNKMDPRVDSDLDGSRTIDNTGRYTSGTGHGSSMTGTGMTGTTGHESSTTGTGGFGSTTGSGTGAGAYDDAGIAGRTGATGPASNTAGPHGSNLANKVDPRVDSDLDASRTVGGDRTFQS